MCNKIESAKRLSFYPYKILRNEKVIYLYTVYASGIFEIDDRTVRLLECEGKTIEETEEILSDIFEKRELEEILAEMTEAKLLCVDDEHTLERKGENISALTLMVVQECNMRCTYCYGDAGEYKNRGRMSRDVALRSIDFLITNSTTDNLHVAFLGGEPLLNFELIKAVVEYCKQKESVSKKKFSYTITTNGTLITDEIENYFIENHIVCQISIDGSKEKNDKNRFFANGRGAYDVVVENTKSMRDKNLVTARATATRNNMNYKEIFNHLDGLKFKAIPIAVAQNMMNDTEYAEFIEMYREYIKYFEQLVKSGEYARARKMTDIMTALEKFEYGSERHSGCGAARYMYAVDINGDLYPCHRFVGESSFCLGNIEQDVNRESFLNQININERDKCKKCWAQNLCLGGCPHENFTVTGSINHSGNRNCKFSHMVYEELFKIYVNLSERDKEIFQDSNRVTG